MRVAVINCGKRKVNKKCEAKDLYIGSLFVASKKFCESNYKEYCILSAKYHCLSPRDKVEYYDLHLGDMSSSEQKVWAKKTAEKLLEKFPRGTKFDFYVSSLYLKYLLTSLDNAGVCYTTHLNNLGLGYKIQWFKNHTKVKRGLF